MAQPPNVVLILADDLGFGDVHCLNPQRGLIPTPNLDRLAAEGLRFLDAHASSSLCSPSRYGLLTGRYSWRSRLQRGIVGCYGPPLIAPERETIATLLRRRGYATACCGKWHLGWLWPLLPGEAFLPDQKAEANPPVTDAIRAQWREAFSQPLGGGPPAAGFEHYFGTDVPNWPPYAFIENNRVQGLPSEFLPRELIGNNLASLPGPALEGWQLERILPSITDRACAFVTDCARARRPFFCYFPLTSPHTPLAVNAPWRGASGLNNAYADLVMETDAMVGRLLTALDDAGAADNTLVIFTADNGCAPYVGVPELEAAGHHPSAQFRGYKSDAWDGGHRIALLARWPAQIAAGGACDSLVCLTDWMATCAELLGQELPAGAGEDSVSLAPLLRNPAGRVRESCVHHSGPGRFAYRRGPWKLVLCAGSGGHWTRPHDDEALAQGLPPVQLYQLEDDPGEQHNLQAERPELVAELAAELRAQVAAHATDVPVDIGYREA